VFSRYGLVLMVTHACNLRCTYCYAGRKSASTMSREMGRRAIDRAIASTEKGGTLELGFFGGEPLLEPSLIAELIAHAEEAAGRAGITLSLSITTNGTIADGDARAIMTRPDVHLAISFDGLPEIHDRHRQTAAGQGSSGRVLETVARLVDCGRDFSVVMVVRPDTIAELPAGIRFLSQCGVRHIEPALDLWTQWSEGDVERLQRAIGEAADVWAAGLPNVSIGWFDEKAAQLARIPISPTARCGFGRGEVAVTPSGRLYPCERLIAEDAAGSPMAIPGDVMDGQDFLSLPPPAALSREPCDSCEMLGMCNTFCRCSNYVRTGDARRPDWLLCAWNQACATETARVLEKMAPPGASGRASGSGAN
jgi:uncharacterized protein